MTIAGLEVPWELSQAVASVILAATQAHESWAEEVFIYRGSGSYQITLYDPLWRDPVERVPHFYTVTFDDLGDLKPAPDKW